MIEGVKVLGLRGEIRGSFEKEDKESK